jgi:hypothetical protein
MFLRCTNRKKDGKEHRHWSVVENRRVTGGRVIQRQVLYLGEINGSQREPWRKTIEVFGDGSPSTKMVALFPEDRTHEIDDEQVVQIRLKDVELRRPRQFGACWLACTLYGQLALNEFWAKKLPPVSRTMVIPHLQVPGNSPLLPDGGGSYCRVFGLSFFL